MLNSRALVRRLMFACLALLTCAALSFRPIPTTSAPNDTGRYVSDQRDACSMSVFANQSNSLPVRTFEVLARPVCWTGEPRFLLFLASMAVPVALIVFAEWESDGALLLGIAYLFSAVGFELMTNALRQGVSLALFCGAVTLKRKALSLALVGAALLLHDSSWVFFPLLFMLDTKLIPKFRSKVLSALFVIMLLSLAAYLIFTRFAAELTAARPLLDIFTKRYEAEVTKSFLLFMVSPILWIVVSRFAGGKTVLSKDEKITFLYSAVVMVLTASFFPIITYRFAMTALVLQLLMAMKAPNLALKSSLLILFGLAGQLIVYACISTNVWNVLHG